MPRTDRPLKTRNRWIVLRSLVFDGPSNAHALGRRIELALSIVQDAFKQLGVLGYSRYLFTDTDNKRQPKVHGPTLEGYVLILTGERALDASEIGRAADQFVKTNEAISMMPREWPPDRLDYDILSTVLGKWDHFRKHDVEDCVLKLLRRTNPEEVQIHGLLTIFYARAWERLYSWELERWNKALAADEDLQDFLSLDPVQIQELRKKAEAYDAFEKAVFKTQDTTVKMVPLKK